MSKYLEDIFLWLKKSYPRGISISSAADTTWVIRNIPPWDPDHPGMAGWESQEIISSLAWLTQRGVHLPQTLRHCLSLSWGLGWGWQCILPQHDSGPKYLLGPFRTMSYQEYSSILLSCNHKYTCTFLVSIYGPYARAHCASVVGVLF